MLGTKSTAPIVALQELSLF